MDTLILVLVALPAIVVLYSVYRRPQRGLLILAAFAPLNGLLTIVPHPGFVAGWKEGLVAVTAICALNRRLRPADRSGPPLHMPWWPGAAVLVTFGTLSALVTYGPIGLVGVKVTFFYVSLVGILWLTPFDASDRDRLVSIIMGMGILVTAVGIAQQIAGPAELIKLGYEYGTQVRSSGPLFRTFSTFNQPFGFGLYVMMALLVGGAVALADPHRFRNRWFLILWPVMAITMCTSVVRAAILGLLIGVIWLAVVGYRYLRAGLTAFGIVLVTTVALLPPAVTKVFFSSSSLGERSTGWSDIIGSIVIHPLGRGMGSSGSAADRMATAKGESFQTVTAGAGGTVQGSSSNYQPDNYYVKLLLELGPIGLWLFLALIITAIVWCTRAWRRLGLLDGALALGVGASMVAAMAASLVATYFEVFPLDLYFWLLLGTVGCACAQHDSRTVRWHYAPAGAEYRPISANS